jgi:hypothetical protein
MEKFGSGINIPDPHTDFYTSVQVPAGTGNRKHIYLPSRKTKCRTVPLEVPITMKKVAFFKITTPEFNKAKKVGYVNNRSVM